MRSSSRRAPRHPSKAPRPTARFIPKKCTKGSSLAQTGAVRARRVPGERGSDDDTTGPGRPVARLRVARRGAGGGAGLHRAYRRHHQGRHRRGAAWRDGRSGRHADRRRRHGCPGRGALRQPRAGPLHRDREALRASPTTGTRTCRSTPARSCRLPSRWASAAWRSASRSRQETPVIETKRQTVSTNVNLDELQNIPSARDPWVVLQTIPGIIVDRVNVGGAESGQQSNYQAKGANPDQNTWNMDGIAITDMGSLGASPTYYDFDMFQEMQVTTGGADPANADAGRAAELRAAQRHQQVARHRRRYYFENNGLQSDNVASRSLRPDCELQPRRRVQGLGLRGRRADRPATASSRGAPTARREPEMQGLQLRRRPQRLRADRARRDDAREHLGEGHRRAVRRRRAPTSPTSAATSRSSAAARRASGPTRRPTTRTARPISFKVEVNQTIGTNLFLVGRYAHTKNGFSLEPRGGRDVAVLSRRFDRVSRVVRLVADTDRPQHNVVARRQHVQGPARPEVRLRLAQGERDVRERLAGQRRPHLSPRLPEHAGARRPRLVAGGRRQVLERATSATRSASIG